MTGRGSRRIASTLVAAALPTLAQAADIYALVIGIDAYQHIQPLGGAVNDARDIADAVATLEPADMRVLIDENATRDAVLRHWRELSELAGPGDTLIVTYAGHGGVEPEAWAGEELDGLNETLLLTGFREDGPGAGERIRDDEIAALIAAERDAEVIIVADSCYSGSVTRAASARLTYRWSPISGIVNDPLPLPPPPADPTLTEPLVFLAAVSEELQSPEIEIDGAMRGALSYAFADALRGAADSDGNGQISKGELTTHVLSMVRRATDGAQTPVVTPAGDLSTIVLRRDSSANTEDGGTQETAVAAEPSPEADDVPGQTDGLTPSAEAGSDSIQESDVVEGVVSPSAPEGGEAAGAVEDAANDETSSSVAAEAGPLAFPFSELPPVALQIEGADDAALLRAALTGAADSVVDARGLIVWDVSARLLRSGLGDTLRRLGGGPAPEDALAEVQLALDKRRLVDAFERLAADAPLDIVFSGGDILYRDSQRLDVEVRGRRFPFIVVFNLASTGEIQPLYPLAEFDDPITLPSEQDFELSDVVVRSPYGADHLVVIETATDTPTLRRTLNRHGGGSSSAAFWEDVRHALTGRDHATAVFPFFTAP